MCTQRLWQCIPISGNRHVAGIAQVEHELGASAASPYGRTRLDAVEQEKLDLYQQHYEEYTRIAKGLQALIRR